jgi:hypothetical protein
MVACSDLNAEPENGKTHIHDENIRLYRKLLAEATHADRREILLKLLAEEEQRRPERVQG